MGRTDVNTATLQQRERLPGVDAALASEIIQDQPFRNAWAFSAKFKRLSRVERHLTD